MVKITLSEHVLSEIRRRQLDIREIERIIQSPEQEVPAKKDRVIIQGRYFDEKENKKMLLRIIGERSEGNFYVITAYKTSKIEKYWKGEM